MREPSLSPRALSEATSEVNATDIFAMPADEQVAILQVSLLAMIALALQAVLILAGAAPTDHRPAPPTPPPTARPIPRSLAVAVCLWCCYSRCASGSGGRMRLAEDDSEDLKPAPRPKAEQTAEARPSRTQP